MGAITIRTIEIYFKTRLVALLAMSFLGISCASTNHTDDSIRPYADNTYYWQYKEEPILLLGGSWQDNLFNHPEGLERHLDLLLENGGNYVRNTMSHHNTDNVYAYVKTNGGYDLDRFNEEYWQRFDNFLRMAQKRNIIVQIEVFDPWELFEDYEAQGGWSKHPYNPANNVNYTVSANPTTHYPW